MKIFSTANVIEVRIVCELLKSQQIHCQVRGDGIVGLQGELPFDDSTSPCVWLLDISQHDQALSIIEQYQQKTPSDLKWQCTQCGEINEQQFGLCWKCSEINRDESDLYE